MSALRLTLLLCLAEIVSMSGFGVFPALQPELVALWSFSNTQAGWIHGVFFGAYMVAVPLLVSLTDRTDPRRVYLFAAGVTLASSLGFALFAEGFWSALVFRALAGMGLAGTYMPGLKLLTDHVEERVRARCVAFYTASFSIGTALSFLVAGRVDALLGWEMAFGLAAAGPLVAGAVVLRFVPPSAVHLVHRPETALLDFRPVFRNRRALAYILAYTAHNWELFALRSWLVAFLVFAGAAESGWDAPGLAAAVTLIGLPSSVLGGEIAQRMGSRRWLLIVMTSSALLACFVGFAAGLPFLLLLALMFVYGVTVTADSATLTAGAVAAARPGERGATMAMHSFVGFGGATLGPLAFGVVLDLAGGGGLAWGLAFASSGLALAFGPLVLWTMGRRAESEVVR